MADTWLPWSAPAAWPKEALALVSCDAQIYRRCPQCGTETRVMAAFAGVRDVGLRCRACGTGATTPVRHLEKVQCQCSSCGSVTELMLAGNEVPRCGRCGRTDLKVKSQGIVPLFPPRFSEAVASHQWGVSGNDDGAAVLSELQSTASSPDKELEMTVLTRFCRRLRLWGGYSGLRDRAILRNIEANLLRNVFRISGELPAGVLALELFEAAVADSADPKDRALEQHNCAMAIYSMLARNSEKEIILATGRPNVRRQAIAHAQSAKDFFAAVNDPGSRIQLAKVLHIIGDLYRAGDANRSDLQQSLENLEAALHIPGLPSQLKGNIELSRESTEGSLERLDEQEAPVEEASQPFENPDNLQYEVIRLEGDPEHVAEGLIRSSLPKTQLDEIDISGQEGLARLFACLMLRRHQASLEKDEILRFVDRNRAAIKAGALEVLGKLAEIAPQVEGGEYIGKFFEYFSDAVTAALEGRSQDIDLKSDRLLWLLYALAQQLSSGKIDYQHAVAILSKPEHRNRISRLSLVFMLQDYAESIGTPNQVPTEYVLLVLECALLSGEAPAAAAASGILARLSAPRDVTSLIDVMGRARTLMISVKRDTIEIDETLRRYSSRFRGAVAESDF